ncbi:hypothetical protein ACFV7Q_27830 [Streptomyces sp. NPDC059851]|uniref:hypothetical protein n=1 Tax=Streptomyces sp. NPDC059851 TaxID=3346971 RepID=UPI00365AA8B8
MSMAWLRQHGHVVLGDIAVRCYKYRSKWTYDERDIRRAAQVFADFRLYPDDVVEVQLPPYRENGDRDPEEWDRANWRGGSLPGCTGTPGRSTGWSAHRKSGTTAGSASAPAGCRAN